MKGGNINLNIIMFLTGITIGMFLIPIIKEVKYHIDFKFSIIKDPVEFIKDVLDRTFTGGY